MIQHRDAPSSPCLFDSSSLPLLGPPSSREELHDIASKTADLEWKVGVTYRQSSQLCAFWLLAWREGLGPLCHSNGVAPDTRPQN